MASPATPSDGDLHQATPPPNQHNSSRGSTFPLSEDDVGDNLEDWQNVWEAAGLQSNGGVTSESNIDVTGRTSSTVNAAQEQPTTIKRRATRETRGRPVGSKTTTTRIDEPTYAQVRPRAVEKILETMAKYKVSVTMFFWFYLTMAINSDTRQRDPPENRRKKIRNLLFSTPGLWPAINNAVPEDDEITTIMNIQDVRAELIRLASPRKPITAFTAWNETMDPADLNLNELGELIYRECPLFTRMMSVLYAPASQDEAANRNKPPPLPPKGALVMAVSMVLHQCKPKKCNAFTRALGLHLANLGASRRMIELLNKLGLTEGYHAVLFGRKKVSRFLAEQLKKLGGKFNLKFLWDNFEWYEKVRHQRIGHTHKQHSVTTAKVVEAVEVPKEGFFKSDFSRRGEVTLDDITNAPGLTENETSAQVTDHLIAKNLAFVAPDLFGKFYESVIDDVDTTVCHYPMPEIELMPVRKTVAHQLGPIMENEGSIEGTSRAKNNMFRVQMGWGDTEAAIKGRLFMGGGDAKTSLLMRALAGDRADATLEEDRHENLLTPYELFHLEINLAWLMQTTHDGETPNVDDEETKMDSKATTTFHRSITGTKNAHGKTPEFFTLVDVLVKSFRARLVAAVLVVNNSTSNAEPEKWMQKKYEKATPEDFRKLVTSIRQKYFIIDARLSEDMEFRNHVLFMQQMETFLALKHSIKHGDIGLIEWCMDRCLLYFSGAKGKGAVYMKEILFYKWLTTTEATSPALKKAIRYNMLVNFAGKRDSWLPGDLSLELSNGALKEILARCRTSTFDLYNLFEEHALLSNYHSSLRSCFESAFNVRINNRHPEQRAANEVYTVAGRLHPKSMREGKNPEVKYVARKIQHPFKNAMAMALVDEQHEMDGMAENENNMDVDINNGGASEDAMHVDG